MARYRKILVAIDGSDAGFHALEEAFKLAIDEKCWITVTSVAPPYQGDLSTTAVGNIQKALKEPAERALAMAEQMAKKERMLIKTVCEDGEPFERIIDLADAENCDIIVMGRTGKSNLERALVGSVTARVIGYTYKDVLVVPKGTSAGWKSIVVASDGSKYSTAAGARAIDFASSYNGELNVISVVDVPPEFYGESPETVDRMIEKARGYAEGIKAQALASGVKADAVVMEGDAALSLIKLAADRKADVICMGSHGRTGLRRLLMGSVAAKVIGLASCPVLIVKS
ncbi:MAG TPA: universal stress protein [Dissulfurispiraceae bacterium]|nr:universal stress protein [Dissulfurispiraceae bacterium]